MKFIAMLRGINVSGQKLIKMADLRAALEKKGLKNVVTYIQSGNILFDTSEKDPLKIAETIENVIKKEFGFDVPCVVKTKEDFKFILDNNDFLKAGKPEDRLYVTFLSNEPEMDKIKAIDSEQYLPEEFSIKGSNLFFFSPTGYGKAKMNNNFFENKLKVKATTRNWKTVNKLFELAQ